jgi:hypothetical protein
MRRMSEELSAEWSGEACQRLIEAALELRAQGLPGDQSLAFNAAVGEAVQQVAQSCATAVPPAELPWLLLRLSWLQW